MRGSPKDRSCPVCRKLFDTRPAYQLHLKMFHSPDMRSLHIPWKCQWNGCQETLVNKDALQNHLYHYHECKFNCKSYLSKVAPEQIRHCHLCDFGYYPSWEIFLSHMKQRHNIPASVLINGQCEAKKSEADSTVSNLDEVPPSNVLDAEGFIVRTRAHYCLLCKQYFAQTAESFLEHCQSPDHKTKINDSHPLAAVGSTDASVAQSPNNLPTTSSSTRAPKNRSAGLGPGVCSSVRSVSPVEEGLDGAWLKLELDGPSPSSSPIHGFEQQSESADGADDEVGPQSPQSVDESVQVEEVESIDRHSSGDIEFETENGVAGFTTAEDSDEDPHDSSESATDGPNDECLDIGTDTETEDFHDGELETPTATESQEPEITGNGQQGNSDQFDPHHGELDFDDSSSLYSSRCPSRSVGAGEKPFSPAVFVEEEEEGEIVTGVEEESESGQRTKRHDKFTSERLECPTVEAQPTPKRRRLYPRIESSDDILPSDGIFKVPTPAIRRDIAGPSGVPGSCRPQGETRRSPLRPFSGADVQSQSRWGPDAQRFGGAMQFPPAQVFYPPPTHLPSPIVPFSMNINTSVPPPPIGSRGPPPVLPILSNPRRPRGYLLPTPSVPPQ